MIPEDIYQQYMYSYPHKTAYRQIEEFTVNEYKYLLRQSDTSLYFHVPFCESKCGYCNLFSVVGQSENVQETYIDACKRQAEQYMMTDVSFSDLTIGGGTPLLLSEKQLERLFDIAKTEFGWRDKPYSIIETSPNQTTAEKLAILKANDISRVSIGVQSFCQDELDVLCRHHTVNQAKKALRMLKDADFSCLNLDLIYGIKGQTMDSLMYSLQEAMYYEPDEIFIYPLYIKPNTILDIKHEKASDKRYEFYRFIADFLCRNGYKQYSMRRFAKIKDSVETQRPDVDCGFENTISIGCGGRSYIGNIHFCTKYSVKQENCRRILNDYINCDDYTKVSYGYILSSDEMKRRYVMKNLLSCRGIYQTEYYDRFKSYVLEDYLILRKYIDERYILSDGTRLYLSEEGLALSDYIGPSLISDEVRQRMLEWKE